MTKNEKIKRLDMAYFELSGKAYYHPIFGWEQADEIDKAYNQVRQEIENEN